MEAIMRSRRYLGTCCFGLLLLLAASTWSAVGANNPKLNALELLRFDVKAAPEDPFDPANQRDAKGVFKVRRGEVVKIVLVGTPKAGFHTYPLTTKTARQPQLSRLEFVKTPGITPLWPITETEPTRHFDKEEGFTSFEHASPFTWSQDIFVGPDAATGMVTVPIKFDTQVCNKGFCVPYRQETKVSFEVSPEEPLPMSPDLSARLSAAKPSIVVVNIPGEDEKKAAQKKDATAPGAKPAATIIEDGLIRDTHAEYKAKIDAIAAQLVMKDGLTGQADADLVSFILAGIFWGAISLITPCVFPMIPITVSFFLKQSEKEHHRPVVMASVYSLTIVIVLTLAAAFLLSIFRWLSVHPATNYFIGALFIFFALSLFGMYEIELPQSLAQFTSSREGKGGLVGTIFMALTFTIISFACVAPFLGGFSGTAAAARPLWHNLLGGLAFSATFASPFFFLALFPSLLRKMPKSGSWLNVVKVVMGFLELAAAFKFFRTAELIQTIGEPSFFTFDLILGIWIALCILCGLYLLGIFRLPHDSPEDHITVPRLLFSAAFLGLAFYLAPALFKVNGAGETQRPGGAVYAWIDAFLLPEAHSGENELVHTANLDYAVAASRKELKETKKPKRIFIDFTGVTCTNCNKNEHNVFTKPGIAKLFEPYILVKIYTDTIPEKYYAPQVRAEIAKNRSRPEEDAKRINVPFQLGKFGTEQLPLYVILEPDADRIHVVGVYEEGLINNVPAFADFLRTQ